MTSEIKRIIFAAFSDAWKSGILEKLIVGDCALKLTNEVGHQVGVKAGVTRQDPHVVERGPAAPQAPTRVDDRVRFVIRVNDGLAGLALGTDFASIEGAI